jgi:L-threonylcarbamoyladenylate synthase
MESIIKSIKAGELFIYPTDTIYGIGCNALDEQAVEKIKALKQRDREKPLSIIAPSLEWINSNCLIDVKLENYLPGPYTIILKKKNPAFLKYVSPTEFIGVRIPACNFSKYVAQAGVPFITTSVNLAGEPFAKSVQEIPQTILDNVDILIDEGELTGKPSTIVQGNRLIERR